MCPVFFSISEKNTHIGGWSEYVESFVVTKSCLLLKYFNRPWVVTSALNLSFVFVIESYLENHLNLNVLYNHYIVYDCFVFKFKIY